MASVLSNRETHNKVPGWSSATGLPLLELGLAVEFVVNATMRADGKLYKISIVGSGLEETLLG
jgi:hypothetical protein